jgi:hypothetical protein
VIRAGETGVDGRGQEVDITLDEAWDRRGWGVGMVAAFGGWHMFAGNIKEQTVIADQPVLVVDGDAILNGFDRVQQARVYLKKAKSDTAMIFRHNGLNWDVCGKEEARGG